MSGTTAINALRYATLGDAANANTLSQNLASDLDTRLIPRFASQAARDAAITSPTNGMFAYTTDTSDMWLYSGSKWKWAYPKMLIHTSSTSVTSSTALVDAAGLTVAVNANSTYSFDCVFFTLAGTAGDVKITHVFPSSDYNIGQMCLQSAATTVTDTITATSTRGSATTAGPAIQIPGAGTDLMGQVYGYLGVGGAGGTFKVQYAQWTSSGTASWLLNGSYMRVTQTG